MQIIQLLPTVAFGDAVGNDAQAIKELLLDMGHKTQIYAENIDKRLPVGTAEYVTNMPELQPEDILLYHGSTGTELNELIPSLGGRKVMIYHNITPGFYFFPYSLEAASRTEEGIAQIHNLSDQFDYCIADSDYNKKDLLKMGYNCPIDVCPILIPFSDYEKAPSKKIIKQYEKDGYTNLLFVGRIAPNKKQEDVIRSFYIYQKLYNEKSRLFLVGNSNGMERYAKRLQDYTEKLGIQDKVIFTGHIKFDEILAYYHIADAFVCMSEHEGFCVPLVEAMFFDVPIIAYNTSAIGDTLGNSGILLEDNNPVLVAMMIDKIVKSKALREQVLKGQRNRLKDFEHKKIGQRLKSCLQSFIEQG